MGGVDPSVTPASSDSVYGIRVTGSLFHFYALQVSSQIHSALRTISMYMYLLIDALEITLLSLKVV
jgi:hypothetical protein